MSDRKVTIDIQTKADTLPIDKVARSLDDLGKKAEDGGKKSVAAAGGTNQLGQAAGRSAELVGSLTSAMAAGGPQAQQLGAGLRVLKALAEGSATGLAGLATVLVGAGVSAYVAYRNKVEAAKQKLAEFAAQIEENKRSIDAAGVEELAGKYDVLRKSIEDTSAALDRLDQAQASLDSAEKAGLFADIQVREKRDLAKLGEGDEVGAARVAAQYAQERRQVEHDFQVRSAERAAASKAGAVADAEDKLRLTGGDMANARAAMDDFAAAIRTVNEQLADLYGKGAPVKEQVDTVMGPGGVPIISNRRMVVDEARQKEQAEKLRGKLKDSKTGPGLETLYSQSAAQYAAAYDRQQKEQSEVVARRTEAEAAGMALWSLRETGPMINLLDAGADQRGVATKERAQAKRDRKLSELMGLRSEIEGQMTSATSERDAAVSRAASARARAASFRPGIDRENGRLVGRADVEAAAQRAAQEAAQLNVNLTAKLNALGRELKAVNDKIKASRDSD